MRERLRAVDIATLQFSERSWSAIDVCARIHLTSRWGFIFTRAHSGVEMSGQTPAAKQNVTPEKVGAILPRTPAPSFTLLSHEQVQI